MGAALRCLSAALLAIAWAWPAPAPAQGRDVSGGSPVAIRMDIAGAIGPATAEFVRKGIAQARRVQAAVLVLRLDTPGGLASSMREIVSEILGAPVPVIAHVAPAGARAASAGTFIVQASHLAAMAPTTHLGAATPVAIGGGFNPGKSDEKTGKSASEVKAINDAVSSIRALADLRGRNADWAEKAVREGATLTAAEALGANVIEIIAGDIDGVLAQADGRLVKLGGSEIRLSTAGITIQPFEADWRTRMLAVITNPNIAYLLLLAGIYGLLFEFVNPGAMYPGVVGGVCLLVGMYALNLLPVNYAGVALLLLGMALMTAEAFMPSFGILGIGGVAGFVLGSLLLFPDDVPGLRLSWPVVALATAASGAFLILALAAAWRAHRRQVSTGEAALLGSRGQVLNWSGRRGEVRVMGERWQAASNESFDAGQRVRIVAREGLTLKIEADREEGVQTGGRRDDSN